MTSWPRCTNRAGIWPAAILQKRQSCALISAPSPLDVERPALRSLVSRAVRHAHGDVHRPGGVVYARRVVDESRRPVCTRGHVVTVDLQSLARRIDRNGAGGERRIDARTRIVDGRTAVRREI